MPRKLRGFYANTFAYRNIYLYLARRSHRNSDVGTPLAALQILLAQRFRLIIRGRLEESQLLWRLGLFVRKGTFRSVRRAHRVLGAKNSLTDADARQLEEAFRAKLAKLESSVVTGEAQPAVGTPSRHPVSTRRRRSGEPAGAAAGIDKSRLARPEPRRVRDKDHVKFVAEQPCLICGRMPADAHHLRFAQHRALGHKASDEFTVPLCRGHHREVHSLGR